MNSLILEMIRKYEVEGDFTHADVTDEMIQSAEQLLGVKLPAQYISFLKMYGHGGICGLEVMGIGLTGCMIFADATLVHRKYDLPKNLVVIENVDEWLMCMRFIVKQVLTDIQRRKEQLPYKKEQPDKKNDKA